MSGLRADPQRRFVSAISSAPAGDAGVLPLILFFPHAVLLPRFSACSPWDLVLLGTAGGHIARQRCVVRFAALTKFHLKQMTRKSVSGARLLICCTACVWY